MSVPQRQISLRQREERRDLRLPSWSAGWPLRPCSARGSVTSVLSRTEHRAAVLRA